MFFFFFLYLCVLTYLVKLLLRHLTHLKSPPFVPSASHFTLPAVIPVLSYTLLPYFTCRVATSVLLRVSQQAHLTTSCPSFAFLLCYAAIQLRSRSAFFPPFINKDINTALIYVRYFKFGTVRVGNCSPSIIAVKNGLWLVTENPQLFSSRVDYLKGDGSPA